MSYEGINDIEEVDSTGNTLARYTQDSGIDQPLAQLRSGTASYYQQDGQGSVSSLSSSSGALANSYTYDSFGKLAASTGTRDAHKEVTFGTLSRGYWSCTTEGPGIR